MYVWVWEGDVLSWAICVFIWENCNSTSVWGPEERLDACECGLEFVWERVCVSVCVRLRIGGWLIPVNLCVLRG